MALYVYITKECEADAKKHNRYDEVVRFKERVEKSQRICLFDNFPPPYLKKRFVRQIRLLADYRTVSMYGEDPVVISFLRIYVRGNREYERFRSDPSEFGKENLAPLVTDEALNEFLAEQLRESPVPQKAPPTELEHHFLYRFLGAT